MTDIHDQAAVVVGGAKGIGQACVEALLNKGVKVCFGDINDEAATANYDKMKKQHGADRILCQKCDASDGDDIKALFQMAVNSWKTVTIVIYIAGYIDEFDFDKCLTVNVRGTIICATTALSHMRKDEGGAGGVFLMMNSVGGIQPVFWGPVYCASKYAMVGYMRSMAEPEQFSRHGVRFNCVCAGAVHSEFASDIADHRRIHFPDLIIDGLPNTTRMAPEDVAAGFIKLIEDTTMNGQALIVSNNHGTLSTPFLDTFYD